jgi:molybdopterin molybdotransferase
MRVSREEAKEIIFKNVKPIKNIETVTLEKAEGRVLSEDVLSPIDVPDVNKSAVDGYAFRSSSLKKIPAKLKIVGETAAGDTERKRVDEGEAVFVMTGGEIPEGADSAVRVEDVEVEGKFVKIDFPVEEGNLVNFRGEEFKKGEVVLKRGEKIYGLKVALLAYLGVYSLKVYSKPRIGVLVTGNEILEPWESFKRGNAYNSNLYIVEEFLKRAGAVTYIGIVRDDREELKKAIEEGIDRFDVLITTGGVSKGKYDFVKEVVSQVGIDVKFTQTNIRPGRPLVFGTKGEKLFFGLPGYPSATVVNLLEFVLPAVKKLSGNRDWENRYLKAFADEPLRSKKGRNDFIRVKFLNDNGVLKVRSSGSQQTSVFKSVVFSDGFAVVPEDRGSVERGDLIDILTFTEI